MAGCNSRAAVVVEKTADVSPGELCEGLSLSLVKEVPLVVVAYGTMV